MIWVTGFGSFLDVTDNPSARLATAVDGAVVAGIPVSGIVLPVSYTESLPTLRRALDTNGGFPTLLLGMGVARGTRRARLERTAVPDREGLDVDGYVPAAPFRRGGRRHARIDIRRFATALDVDVSDDAGRYVCNAWLDDALAAFPHAAVAFLHVPDQGFPASQLLTGLARYFTGTAAGAPAAVGAAGAVGTAGAAPAAF